jgi:sugar lactone lactonase YvrE
LIADVRGYSGFTDREGNEAAARLAARFEALAREVVTAGGGHVLDIRGDEVAADFASPSRALQTAMVLQQRLAAVLRDDSSLPLRVGVGVDVGEAVSVGEGYRGGALNRAARLCSLAQAGEVLLTESALHLAGPIPGAAYASRGRVRIKGIAEPLSVRQLVFDIELPKAASGSHRRRRRIWISAVAVSLAVGTTIVAVLLSSRGGGSGVAVAANSVAAINPHTGHVIADVTVGATPTQVAAGSGYVWVLNANNKTISRVDPRKRQTSGSPFSVSATPTGLAAGAGALWVAAGDKNAVLRVNPATELQEGAPIPVPGSINTYLHELGVSFGAGQVYVISSGGTIARLDPAVNKVVAHVPGPADSGGVGPLLAADPHGLWVASSAGIDHLAPRQLSPVSPTVPGPQYPNAVALGAGSAWVTDESGDSVWRIDADLGRLDHTIPVGGRPSAVTVGAGAVWVATVDGTVTRIDPNTDATTKINVGGTPASLAIADGLVWVAVV